MLLAKMMKNEVFHQLRTEQSLGYIATALSASSPGETNNVDYLVLMVVFEHILVPMLPSKGVKNEKFELFLNGTISDLKQKEVRLSAKTALLWDEIMGHSYRFGWKREFAEILETMTVREMVEFYREHVLGKEAKWISIQLFHQKEKRKRKGMGHRIVANREDANGVLYFNATKDLMNLGYAQYYDVF